MRKLVLVAFVFCAFLESPAALANSILNTYLNEIIPTWDIKAEARFQVENRKGVSIKKLASGARLYDRSRESKTPGTWKGGKSLLLVREDRSSQPTEVYSIEENRYGPPVSGKSAWLTYTKLTGGKVNFSTICNKSAKSSLFCITLNSKVCKELAEFERWNTSRFLVHKTKADSDRLTKEYINRAVKLVNLSIKEQKTSLEAMKKLYPSYSFKVSQIDNVPFASLAFLITNVQRYCTGPWGGHVFHSTRSQKISTPRDSPSPKARPAGK